MRGATAHLNAFLHQTASNETHTHAEGINCKIETPHTTMSNMLSVAKEFHGHFYTSNVIFGQRRGDNIVGGDKADCLDGQSGSDKIQGRGGDDFIAGGNHRDHLDGGHGDDTLVGGWGNDTLRGGPGSDTAVYDDRPVHVTLSESGSSTATVIMPWWRLWNNRDTLFDIENIWGSTRNDKITGNSQDNVLFGRSGHDHLNGGGGSDTLRGGRGHDHLTGGADADRFVLDVHPGDKDVITDFNKNEGDKLDFTLFSGAGLSVTFSETSPKPHSFWLKASHSKNQVTLHVDTDGNAATNEVHVTVRGVTTLGPDDFLL